MTCNHMEPTGTIWAMSPERRPRIPADLAARIDAARGYVPFERYIRTKLEQVVPAGKTREVSVENYLATLNEDLQNGMAYDFVSSLEEWHMFKKALALWVEQQEGVWDDIARDAEHGEGENA